MNILEVQNLCKTYGKGEAAVQALRDVTSVSYTHLINAFLNLVAFILIILRRINLLEQSIWHWQGL